jgi:osmotically-inducible protein OsmY
MACGGQARSASQPQQAPPTVGGTATFSPAGAVPDDVIVRTMERELGRDPLTAQERIGVDSQAGVLTLEGPVGSRLTKERAVRIAHVVRGVRAVVDRTEVVAFPRPDYEIDAALAEALSRDPVTAGQPIAARAHEGIALLSGTVDSDATRRIAEARALAIPGVLDAVNELAVRTGRPDDRRMTAEVERLVRDDPWLDDSRVRVTVHSGVVHLDGWVGSPEERARAQSDSWAASPAGVDASGLVIDGFTDDGTLRSTPRLARSDADLEQSLLDAFVRDPRVHPFSPTIEVRGGVVALTGVAPNPHVARAVDEDARALPGAGGVRDEVRTLPAVYEQSDARVRDEILRMLSGDSQLGDVSRTVSVEVVDGRVFLRGTVRSEVDRLRLLAIATSPPGARSVDDGLVVVVAPRAGVASPQPAR